MRLIKQELLMVIVLLLFFSAHVAYVINSATPKQSSKTPDSNTTLTALTSHNVSVDPNLTDRFSLLYGIQPLNATSQTEEVEKVVNIFSAMAPRLLAINIEQDVVTVHVLVNENGETTKHTLIPGDTLFGFRLVKADLHSAIFSSENETITLNMFKTFMPTSVNEN